ncbi:hypothetical protein D3C86_1974090 [compost metagenome]
MSKTADLDALAPHPGETERVIKRMQHRKRQVNAHQGQAGRSQPLAKALDDRLQRLVAERRSHEPVRDLVDQDFRYVVVYRAHFVSSP